MSSVLPVHTVTLDGFYMDKTEVTVGQFKQFAAETGYMVSDLSAQLARFAFNLVEGGGDQRRDDHANIWKEVAKYSPTDEHPMIYVNWHDAVAYAKWAGK